MSSPEDARLPIDRASLLLGKRVARTPIGSFEVHFFRDQTRDASVMAIAQGDLSQPQPLPARVHSSCVTSECLMARDCDCVEQLAGALERIAADRRGVVFYLIQEGRGAGLTAKARDRMMVQASDHAMTTFEAYAEMGLPPDLRRYDVLGPMVRALGIRGPFELLSNNPDKVRAISRVLVEEKIEVESAVSIEGRSNAFNRAYLTAKRRSGHLLSGVSSDRGSLPPEPVEVEAVRRAKAHPFLISTASYQLPVDLSERRLGARSAAKRRADVAWFRVRVVYDERTAKEAVLLELGQDAEISGSPPEAFCLGLIDRLPCEEATRREALRQALSGMRERGRGRAVVFFDEVAPWTHFDSPGAAREAMQALALEIGAARWESSALPVSLPAPHGT